jgi:hypothetical protein
VRRGCNTYKHTGKIKAATEQEARNNLAIVYGSFFTKIISID